MTLYQFLNMYSGDVDNIAVYDVDDDNEFTPPLLEGTKDEILDTKYDSNTVFGFMIESKSVSRPTLLIFIIVNH